MPLPQQDGTPPISEHIILHLRHGGDKSDSHLNYGARQSVIAYAHIDATDLVAGPSVELVVHPDHRKSGLGKELLSKSKEICGKRCAFGHMVIYQLRKNWLQEMALNELEL
jgi:mycothiol synthase